MSRKLTLCDTPGLCNTKPNLVHGRLHCRSLCCSRLFMWTRIFLWRPFSQKSLKYCQWTLCHQPWAICNRFFWDVCMCINVYTFTESPSLMQTVISLFVGKSLVSWIPEGDAGSWTSLKTLHSSPVCNGWGKTVVLEYFYFVSLSSSGKTFKLVQALVWLLLPFFF